MGDTWPDAVPIGEAAERLGLSTEAVRKRIQRGTLPGRKVDGAWFVAALALPAATAGRPDDGVQTAGQVAGDGRTGGRTPPSPPPVDLAPLASLIERQGGEIKRLTEAATAWQMRALQAEEKLKALEAGAVVPNRNNRDAPTTRPEAPGATETPDPAFRPSVAAWRERTSRAVDLDEPGEPEPWWRRWWRGVTGR